MENLEYIVIIGFVFVVFIILLGVSIYFIRKGDLTADTWHMRSLGLPRGSVRAIVAFIILFFLVYTILAGKTVPEQPEWIVGILGTVIGFYFGAAMAPTEKKEEKKPEVDKAKKKEGG
jgi:amino acid transporter